MFQNIFDSHAHYDDGWFDADRDALLASLPEKGVCGVVNNSVDLENAKRVIALAEQYDFIYAAVGWHPEEWESWDSQSIPVLRELAQHKKVVAIGEIGLDYYYDDVPREIQKHWFDRQMALAEELSMPVVVHDRDAHGDCMDMVRKWAGRVTGVFHCFSGSAEMAAELTKLGWYVSFTGVVTFKNARRALEAVAAVPMDRIMIETDAPYMAPVPYRGRRNHSGYVPLVAEKIAEVKGMTLEEVAKITTENGKRFFRIPE